MATGFRGIYPMMYAYFDRDGALDLKAMATLADAMVRRGVHGVAVLGLATEVNKLSLPERRQALDCVAEAVGGRVPLSVTVAETSIAGQIEFGRAAKAAGAKWLVLQPPPVKGIDESELMRFFGAVADGIDLPVGIQNAPQYLGIGLSNAGLLELARRHGNFRLVKTEATAVAVERLFAETEGRLDIFNGRGGLETPDVLRAGAAGIIPAGEACDRLSASFDAHAAGDVARAEAAYREALPAITFLEDTIDHLCVYGKLISARRLGLEVKGARIPSTPVTAFGAAAAERFARELGPL